MPTLSLKEKDNSKELAIVIGGDLDGSTLWLDENGDKRSAVTLPPDSHFIVEPTHDSDGRDLIFCAGPSGSGKSTFIKQFSQRYHKLWPDRFVVLISKLDDDSTLDSLPFLQRIRVDSLLEKKLELEELRSSLLLVDDVEGLPKPVALAVQELVDLVCNQGRHYSISMIYASHLLSNYKQTRNLLHECQTFVLYPNGTSFAQLRHCLGHYAGLDKAQVAMVRKLPSRWISVRKLYPPLVIYDTGAKLLNAE